MLNLFVILMMQSLNNLLPLKIQMCVTVENLAMWH